LWMGCSPSLSNSPTFESRCQKFNESILGHSIPIDFACNKWRVNRLILEIGWQCSKIGFPISRHHVQEHISIYASVDSKVTKMIPSIDAFRNMLRDAVLLHISGTALLTSAPLNRRTKDQHHISYHHIEQPYTFLFLNFSLSHQFSTIPSISNDVRNHVGPHRYDHINTLPKWLTQSTTSLSKTS
jgi:hypothetical protein